MGDAIEFLQAFGVESIEEFIGLEIRDRRRNRPSSIKRFRMDADRPKVDPKGEWVRYEHHLHWAQRMRRSLKYYDKANAQLRHDLKRALANHAADLTGGAECAPEVPG